MGIGAVHVTRADASASGQSGYVYTVTFLDQVGDVPLLEYDRGTLARETEVNVTEFLKVAANEFTIEPRKASGHPVRDRTAHPGHEGGDYFFTELWHLGHHRGTPTAGRDVQPRAVRDPARRHRR